MKPIFRYLLVICVSAAVLFGIVFVASGHFGRLAYQAGSAAVGTSTAASVKEASTTTEPVPFVATHVKTPEPVKALYMTSWVAGTPSLRTHVVSLIDSTEANAIVIDIKDYTGRVSYKITDPELAKIGSSEVRIRDLDSFIETLHQKGIYVIGRVAAFQDPYMVKLHPDWAVKTKEGGIWKDHKGISWIDAGATPMWKYIVDLSKESYKHGFDEINFDYVRFPSDGNMQDIAYSWSGTTAKSTIMRKFYTYIHDQLIGTGIVTSADLFGMTTTANDDMNIGQVLTDALANFDYVAPMVYPSHFPATWNGYKNPAAVPYQVISVSMGSAVKRAEAASTSPLKLRPWLQDFNLGAVYTADMVRAQIKATYDVGLTSWMMWDASNKYTPNSLLPQ